MDHIKYILISQDIYLLGINFISWIYLIDILIIIKQLQKFPYAHTYIHEYIPGYGKF